MKFKNVHVLIKVDTFSTELQELVKNILKIIDIEKYELTNVKYYRPSTIGNKDELIIIFDEDIQFQGNQVLRLPALELLVNKPQNSKYREETATKLTALKDFYSISCHNLPNITIQELQLIKQELIKRDIKAFTVTLADGGLMRIIFSGSTEVNRVENILINFDELIAMKMIQDVFAVSKIEIEK